MESVIIIPARYDSTRFPGKPLIDMKGKTMIQRVYQQCLKADADKVVIATDSPKIFKHVKSFTDSVIMTGKHESGTDRIIAALFELEKTYDIIVNVQGDEPFISPDDINLIIDGVKECPDNVMTLVTYLNEKEKKDPNVVKCLSCNYKDVYMFTRSPFYSDYNLIECNKHIGIYGFSDNTVYEISKLKEKTKNEIDSNLEQLRWMDAGIKFNVAYTRNSSIGIDTKEDLEEALKYYK